MAKGDEKSTRKMSIFLAIFVLTLGIVCKLSDLWTEFSFVAAPCGTVKGLKHLKSSDLDRTILSYTGIPYGKAPVGELRFQRPLPKENITDGTVIDATRSSPRCVQPPFLRIPYIGSVLQLIPFSDKFPSLLTLVGLDMISFSNHIGQEDCLYLNVFAPEASNLEVSPKYECIND